MPSEITTTMIHNIHITIKIYTLLLVFALSCGYAHAQDLPIVSVFSLDNTASESGSTGEIIVQLDRPAPPGGLTVHHDIGGNATPFGQNDSDYAALPSSVFFEENQTAKSLIIRPLKDSFVEDVEVVSITLRAGDGYLIGNPSQATVSIVDDTANNAPMVSLAISDSLAHEENNEPARFEFRLSSSIDRDLSIHYQTGGSATPGNNDDYQPLSGTATLIAGSTVITIPLTPFDDNIIEGDETISITLVPAEGYLVNNRQQRGVITLIDNDNPVNSPENPSNSPGILTTIEIATPQKAKLDGSHRLSAKVVDANNTPVPGANTQWSLDNGSSALGGMISQSDTLTNSQGITAATINTGTTPGNYRLTVTVSLNGTTLSKTIDVAVGLISHVADQSTEGRMASALDKMCPRLINTTTTNSTTQSLASHCQALLSAAINNESSNLSKALRQIAPEELLSQRLIASQTNTQIQQRLKTRLQALRHNPRPVSFSQLSYRTSEDVLTGSVFNSLLPNGGSAGNEDIPERWSYFVSGNLGDGSQKENQYESGFDFNVEGITSGADYRIDNNTYVGIAVSYTQSEIDFGDKSGKISNNGYSLSLYGNYSFSNSFYLDTILSFGQLKNKSQRFIEYTLNNNTVSETAKGAPNGTQSAFASNLGFQKVFASGLNIDLYTGIEYLNTATDSYQETGAGAFNLNINKQRSHALTYEIGSAINRAFSQPWGIIIPQFDIKWRYEDSNASGLTGYFIADNFSTPFQLQSEQLDQSYFISSAGVSTLLANGLALFVQYETVLDRSSYNEQQIAVGARFSTQW